MTSRVIVAGAGNIGRRHLQALLSSESELELIVLEPSAAARAETKDFVQAIGNPGRGVLFVEPDGLPERADAAIVATTAKARRNVIDLLLERISVPLLVLEKFLFQDPGDFGAVETRLGAESVRAWVNTPRRAWPRYQALQQQIAPPRRVEMEVSVPAPIGIGSNAIHFLDLLAFLSDRDDFSVDATDLDPTVLPAKREGFVEFTGAITASGADGSRLVYRTVDDDRIIASISWDDERVVCDETNGGFAVLQSRLTDRILADLIARGDCDLTPYEESARLHMAILEPLLEHYRRFVDPSAQACPIT